MAERPRPCRCLWSVAWLHRGEEEGKSWSRKHLGVLLLTEFPLPCLCHKADQAPSPGRERGTVAAHASELQLWTLVSHGLLGS